LALVRGTLRTDDDNESEKFLRNFDPQFSLPIVVTSAARIERGFVASPNSNVTRLLEDFDGPTGTSEFGIPNDASNVTVEHVGVIEHGIPFSARDAQLHRIPLPAFLRAGRITWQRAGGDVFFQINFTAPGSGFDLSGDATLDFRIDRETPTRAPGANPSGPSNFHVQLVGGNGSLSHAVAVSNFIDLVGPFGTPDANFGVETLPDGYHLNSPTARIPIAAFASQQLNQVRGIRLTFDDTATGKIYVANFRASVQGIGSIEGVQGPGDEIGTLDKPTFNGASRVIEQGTVIENVRFVPAADFGTTSSSSSGTVRFDVWSETAVPVGDEILVMQIGSAQCDGMYVGASTQRMTFQCLAEALPANEGQQILVRANGRATLSFGTFSSEMVN
jgi:hypothetical protein